MSKILIIEDDDLTRSVIRSTLESEGYEVFETGDGDGSVEMAAKHLPDLVLCDIEMPKLDGFSTLMAFRSNDNTAPIPFIFLTGKTDRSNVRKGMELGADDYLLKPFTKAELIGAVDARFQRIRKLEQAKETKFNDLQVSIRMSIPHELRTPLNGIMVFSEMLQDNAGTLKPEEITEMSGYIHQSAQRLHHTIENFIIYTQLELLVYDTNQRASFRNEATRYAERTVETVAHAVAETWKRSADLELNLKPFNVQVPEMHLSTLVKELTDNAFKFSEKETKVRIISYVNEQAAVLEVSDLGRGMSKEQIQNIGGFMQFERKHYEQQGSGLGQIISKRIAELHEGAMIIESEKNKGTTVRVMLPLMK
jgi:signal transduction histidine kinase